MHTFADFDIDVPTGRQGEIDTTCPRCSHTRRREHQRQKCLSVNIDKGKWKCHNCGRKGGLAGGWMDMPVSGVPYGSPIKEYKKPVPPVNPQIGIGGLQWFANRGITAEIVQRFGVFSEKERYFSDAGEDGSGAKLPTVCFPYFRGSDLVNIKFRSARGKHFQMAAGAEKIFYNIDAVQGADKIVIVEGEMDVFALAVAGIDFAISVPNGAKGLTDDVMASLATVAERESVKFIIAVDMDADGNKLAEDLARRLGKHRCSRVSWFPEMECKDANEVLLVYGNEPEAVEAGAGKIRECIAAAKPWPIEGIVYGHQLMDAYLDFYRNGLPGGATVGFPTIDEHYRVRLGQLTMATGMPGDGKSSIVAQFTVALAERYGWRFAFYSPENQPYELLMAQLAGIHLRLPFEEGAAPRMTEHQAIEGGEWVDHHYGFILSENPTVESILERAKAFIYQRGIKGIVIDPWNKLEHARPSGLSEHEYIGQSLTKIQNFARLHGIHVWVVAHPTKLQKNADGSYPVATMYDISGSSHFYNMADMGISVWRDKTDPFEPVQLYVQKVRFRRDGQVGMVELAFSPSTNRYADIKAGGFTTPEGRGETDHEELEAA